MIRASSRVACCLLAAGAILLPPAPAARGDVMAMTLEGEPLSGSEATIGEDGVLVLDGGRHDLEALRYVVPDQAGAEAAPDAAESPLRVILICGSDLRAADLTFEDEQFTFASRAVGETLRIPVDSVRAVRLALPIPGSRFEETLELEADRRLEDTVFVTGVAGELLELNCLIEGIGADTVTFDRNGKREEIAREKVHGVILASPDLDEPMPCRVIMNDRSTFAGEVRRLAGGTLTVAMIDGIEVGLPWANVRRLRIYSPRLVAVSDLDPESVETQPILAPDWQLQRDRSVAGGELTLGEDVYESGLGFAAGMRATYALGGDFDLFTATIGIDAETRGRGDCEFVVRGDGRELARQRMAGGDPAQLIKVDVSGVRELELAVEAGANLDIGDHADWAEASLLQRAN